MTLYERLLKIEHRAAIAWLVIVAVTHCDAGVAFPIWMVLAASMLALAGWWLARAGLSLAVARDARELWRSRLFVPAVLLVGVLLATSDLAAGSRSRGRPTSRPTNSSRTFRCGRCRRRRCSSAPT